MIQDCLDIFKKYYARHGERLILDHYLPKDGAYILVEIGEQDIQVVEQLNVRYDKKNDTIIGRESTLYDKIKFLDYSSKLIEMNKPIDASKIIHTNNYMSFGFKKDSLQAGKLLDEVIDGYYNVLAEPQLKYTKKNARELYEEAEAAFGPPDQDVIARIRQWIKQFLQQLTVETSTTETLIEPIDFDAKDYLKLFFVFSDWRNDWSKTERIYQQENQRYLIPNIYNNNEYNLVVNGQIMGLPNDNVGLNAKKPYLINKSRKTEVPYLLNREDVIIQGKFYDYLMGLAAVGNVHVYFDTDNEKIIPCKVGTGPNAQMNGYFLRIRKGKEVEIHHVDTVVEYNPNMKPPFLFKRIMETEDAENYGSVSNRFSLEGIIDDVFFSKVLKNNYFTKPEELNLSDGIVQYNLLMARDQLHTWIYKDAGIRIGPLIEKVSGNLIRNSIARGHWRKVQHQLNLRWSFADYFSQNGGMENIMRTVVEDLKEHLDSMEMWDFEKGHDEEYYYAVGQLVSFFLTKSRAKNKPLSFVNPFLNARSDEEIKRRLALLLKKYNYAIPNYDLRFRALYSAVKRYIPETDLHTMRNMDMLEAGFVGYNFIFKKRDKEEAGTTEVDMTEGE